MPVLSVLSVLRALLAALALCAFPVAALAEQERITSFDAVIVVEPSGVVSVTETITAVAQGQSIKRGIYRDLLMPGRNWMDAMSGAPYRVLSARRGASPESWRTQDSNGAFRIYMGAKDVLLKPGTYSYTLKYEAFYQIRRFEGYDELYWNVTGNGWAYPVERARAVVVLPPGAGLVQSAAYTGPQGFTGKDFTMREDGPGRLVFQSTRPLSPGEGLTVAVAWPKGHVAQPGWAQRLEAMAAGNPYIILSMAGFAAMLIYFLAAWFKVGRDPAPGTVIPLYAPPPDMSPAAVSYVHGMGHDSKDLSSTMVSLAVSGVLVIEEKKKGEFVLTRPAKAAQPRTLDENLAAEALFRKGVSVTLDQASRQSLVSARDALRKALRDAYTGYLFNPNVAWFIPGAALGVVAALGAAFSGSQWEASAFMALWLTVWTFGTVFLLRTVAASWHQAVNGRGAFLKWAGALFTTAFVVPFVLGELAGMAFFGFNSSPLALALLMATVTACVSFHHLLKAPTAEGRRVMDQIEGFRLYLGVAEEERLNLINPPEETPELFERFLPYAMALGLEHQWGQRFADVLARASQTPDGYTPVWYHGSSWDPSSPSAFSDSLASGFASAVSSSSGSSGSGGGGSSGGGGGW